MNIQIVLYKSRTKLPHLLKSLELADSVLELKLHFLQHDNEDYQEILRNCKFEYTIDKHDNIGFGAGHNFLFQKYGKEYDNSFLVSNPDCIYFFDFFASLNGNLNKLINWGLIDFTQFPHEHPKPFDPVTLKTPWCSASALLVNTAAFRQVGGFDDLIFMYGEDVDLSWRIKYSGFELYHLPICRVAHYVGASSADESGHGESPFAAKHMHAAELYLTAKFSLDNSKGVEWIKQHSPYKREAIEIYEKMKPVVRHPKAEFMKSLHAKRWQIGT